MVDIRSVDLYRLKQSSSKKVTTKQQRLSKDRKNFLSSPATPPTIKQGERTSTYTTYTNSANSASSYVKIRAKMGPGPPANPHRAVQAWQQHNTADTHQLHSTVISPLLINKFIYSFIDY